MNSKEIQILVILALFISSCTFKKPEKISIATNDIQTLVEIDLENSLANLEEINLSEICDSITYIKLETMQGSLLGKILNYQVNANQILINCLSSVLLFDRSGRFLRKIGRNGKGPEEFTGAYWVDGSHDTIAIATKQKILFYTSSGKFINYISWKYGTGQICLLPNYRLAISLNNLYGNDPYRLAIVNRVGDSLRFFKTLEITNFHPSVISQFSSFEQHFYKQNSKLFYRESYNDTIFSISSTHNLVPEYFIRLGKYKIPIEHRLESLNDTKKFAKIGGNYLDYRIEESKNYMFFNYHTRDKGFGSHSSGFSFYDKNTKKINAVGHRKFDHFQMGFFNDIDGGITFIPDGTMPDGDIAYKLLYPFELKKFIRSSDFQRSPVASEIKSNFEDFVNSLKEDENPVIMLVKLKDK